MRTDHAVGNKSLGETHRLLGSSALNLGNPRQALTHFQDISTAHRSEG
ncbi:hypothetical protein [Streptomyces sp. DT9]